MTADDVAGRWHFEPHAPSDEDLVQCNSCEVESPLSAWVEGEVYCEDCGEHAAMVCPSCGHHEDVAYSSHYPMTVISKEMP